MKKIKIVISGGGTLGHIIPIIPVVTKLKKDDNYELYFIGSINGIEHDYIEKTNLFSKTFYLDSIGFSRKFSIKNALTIYKLLKSYQQAKRILKELEADLVIGMGGYVSAASIIAAKKLHIKTMIHEQNRVYGFTNRHLKNKVDRVLLAYNIEENEKVTLVGNPRTTEIFERFKTLNKIDNRSLLVVGGSRGAERINELIFSLKDDLLANKIDVKLITGRSYYNKNLEKIKNIESLNFQVIDFVYDLPLYIFNSSLVISRCGATTLAEIIGLRAVSILIPSPNVTANHQEKNAIDLEYRGGAIMLKESELTKDLLLKTIIKLMDDKQLRNSIISNLNFISFDNSREKFIEEIEKTLRT